MLDFPVKIWVPENGWLSLVIFQPTWKGYPQKAHTRTPPQIPPKVGGSSARTRLQLFFLLRLAGLSLQHKAGVPKDERIKPINWSLHWVPLDDTPM